jgi:hypothetical protein
MNTTSEATKSATNRAAERRSRKPVNRNSANESFLVLFYKKEQSASF